MDVTTAMLDLGFVDFLAPARPALTNGHAPAAPRPHLPADPEVLRRVAWEIGEKRPGDHWQATANHVGLGMVHPTHGFAYWRILPAWMHDIARQRGGAWDGSRPVLRLYDVSYITFTGFNANRIQDEHLPDLFGQRFFNLPNPGTWQLAEVGFLLRNGEFIPAARSPVVPFAPDSPSRHGGTAGLLVHGGRVEEVGNVWDQERELRERRRPRLRQPLRIAAFAFASRASGQDGTLATFVSELAAGQSARGHEVHLFVPAGEKLPEPRAEGGIHYHPLRLPAAGSPLDQARAFGAAARRELVKQPPFDLFHLHEWMTGLVPGADEQPAVLSLGSLETTRRNGTPPDDLSKAIELAERELAHSVRCVLTPGWLRERAVSELGLETGRVHAFAMEGRLPNEWECGFDAGQVKREAGFGPLDRLLLYVGPLEHSAGVDLPLEALPVVLRRWPGARLAYVGLGPMGGHLHHRAGELGVGYAVRQLGHVHGGWLTRLLRSAEALVLPSRFRQPQDDLVVDLARRAGRPVVTTHGGPAHLVRHEENGLVTYDNPGSMVWALDRILSDPGHAERMGQHGRRGQGGAPQWPEVAGHYLEKCAAWFPELTETRM
jgi:glycosyltransferase involved in cell wall biosynthesis